MKKRIKIKNDKGFSLVELLVVMAIMAILVGAIAPQVNKYVEKSRESRDLQLVSTVFTAVQTGIATSEKPVGVIDHKPLGNLLDTYTEFSTETKNEIKDLLGPDLDQDSDFKDKCLSKKGHDGTLYVDYTEAGKLSVYISKSGNMNNADNIGPVTN
ncbi:type II secretion system protein [Anaerocolumna sp. MB42-C2]|uniref:type II secretion system protein n=1 Tax=Anaerocolumna sp. MB42-C2 TaxID=3070997 RepID=UPI0027DF2B68|nr:type II secretion system protein [Anaerocolumna sp. MB42-C2]WMJ88594.1 type II secretion system protein [Anaerocolumna sp. MB42-C2]